MHKTLSILLLATAPSLGATACNTGSGAETFATTRGGKTTNVGTGSGLTMNTSQWASSTVRDIYEFKFGEGEHVNYYGYKTQLVNISLSETPFGPVSTEVGPALPPDRAGAELIHGDDFTVRVEKPGEPPVDLVGAELVGLRLDFIVGATGPLDNYDNVDEHAVDIEFVGHSHDESAGDFYEIVKVDPETGEQLGPVCAADESGDRKARIFDGLAVNGETGEITFIGQEIRHIACSSSAPVKAALFGYPPSDGDADTFTTVSRIVRADYCADGHPYTYPGNLLGIGDNFLPGREGLVLEDIYADLEEGQVVEALWDAYGVLCVDSPRADNVDLEDVVCPIKRFADGSVAYNWRPPHCTDFVDADPEGKRFFSTAHADE